MNTKKIIAALTTVSLLSSYAVSADTEKLAAFPGKVTE